MDFQAPPTIPLQRQGELRDVLLEICRVDADGNIDPSRSWQDAVHAVEVLTEIGGGRSGATVLDVNVRMNGQPGFERRVVKVAAVSEIAAEWKALNAVRVRRQNTLIVPIDAVSSDVQEPSQHWLEGQLAAIVYQHVGAFAAMPHRRVQTLEELVASA
ncbi:MAG TPA: hypothetical protein VFC01_05440, partial [Mycobacterium sp.]|nr:hypothetical protein [Mycobacterium sp.]